MKQLLFLLLFPCLALAQYPGNAGQKITLGEQTTADGLIWRGVAADTTLTAKSDTAAYFVLDTVNLNLFTYKASASGAKWRQLGADTAAIAYVNTYGTQTVNGDKTFTSAVTATRFNPTANTVTGTGMYLPATNALGLSTNGVQRMHITSAGNVGFGAIPFTDYNFQVSTNSGSGNEVIFVVNNIGTTPNDLTTARFDLGVFSVVSNYVATNTVLGQTNFIGQANDARYTAAKIDVIVTNAGNVGRANGHSGIMRFYTKPTNANGVSERMRINEVGELGIGYGVTDNGAYKLQVNSQIFATNATIATSDIRFKENIQPLDKGLEIINKLKPVKFNFISTTENNFSEFDEIGFIAQDVEGALSTELFAKAVVKKLDEDKDDSPLGLMTEKLIPILTKAIQEQQALIKALEQRLLILENK